MTYLQTYLIVFALLFFTMGWGNDEPALDTDQEYK